MTNDTTRHDVPLLEDEDGAPYPEEIQEAARLLVAEVAAQARRDALEEAADAADTVIISWSGVAGLHPTEPEPHPAALRASGARRTLVVLRSRMAEAFDDLRALADPASTEGSES